MKIAINAVFYTPKGGGIKEYIHNLILNLDKLDSENEYVVYVLKDQLDFAKKNLPVKFRFKTVPFSGGSTIKAIIRSLFESFYWNREQKIEKWDVFHSPFFHAPNLRNTISVITVHDMRFYRFPKTYKFFRYHFLKHSVRKSLSRADEIISISDFTKREILSAYNLNPDKITIIHEAINPATFQTIPLSEGEKELVKALENKRYVLSVGHLEPRKNFNRLVRAFSMCKPELSTPTKLVIVGKKSQEYASTLDLISKEEDAIYLDFVSPSILNWLYNHAALFVFPSYYEGFGFPPLEAAVHNVISAVSNLSSIPEVCGDAAVYFNPFDEKQISVAIKTGLEDKAKIEEVKGKLKKQLDSFSWENNAKETIRIYNKYKKQ